ncbi:hypothetical protein [Dyella sp. Tek66A03]|uniref:hypothetical protein n=1 Tax=Dyella sp. Tek66A03 TaxID=3458298 RepID=UPI00403E80B2
MKPTSIQKFDMDAAPPSWYEVAKALNAQARTLQKSRGVVIHFTDRHGNARSRYEANRGVFLLAGFSIENILKAFLIYEDPALIADGQISRKIRTHALSKLWEASSFVPYKRRYGPTVASLEDGLESWARYPCGLNHERNAVEGVMTDKLWAAYLSVFSACSKRLERLLSKGWVDHNGEFYSMSFEHFD